MMDPPRSRGGRAGILPRWHTWAPPILGLGFLSALALHGFLGTYSRYIADDFCSAAMAHRFGILRAVWYWYLNWTGRYSASALDASFGLLGPAVTPTVTAVVLIIWLAAILLAVSVIARGRAIPGSAFAPVLALALLYLTLVLSPNVAQSLYWGQGMRSIVPPLILSAIYAVLLHRFGAREWSKRHYALWLAGDGLLAFLIGGFNETFTALELSILILAVLVALTARRPDQPQRLVHFLIVGAVGAGLAFLVVVLAPGNAIRQAFYPAPSGPLRILSMAAGNFVAFLAATFSPLENLLAVLAVISLSLYLGLRLQAERPRLWLAPLSLIAGFAVAFECFLPAAYGLSEAPPDRTLMIPAHVLSIALMLSSLIAGIHLGHKTTGSRLQSSLEAGILVIAAVFAVGSVSVSDGELLAKRAAYADYAASWDLMNAQIIQARASGQNQVEIQPKVNWAGLDEPNDNPKFWVNVCYRQYYGLQVLAASPP